MNHKEILMQILAALRRLDQDKEALWSLEEIAFYIKGSVSTARTLTQAPNFPRPVRLPTSENGGQPRWYAGEVKAFCRRFKCFK